MSLREWRQLTWEEIGSLPAQGMDGALLPVGATEQHRPHLGCGVGTEIAHQLCHVAAENDAETSLMMAIAPHLLRSEHLVNIPMNGGRCESRNADGSLNPYLPATLALAAGLEGIREELDPGEPQNDNLYELSEAQRRDRGIRFLPQNLAEAVKAFAADPFVEQVLGRELRDEFIRYKSQEWEAYHLSISPWEIERYSHLF